MDTYMSCLGTLRAMEVLGSALQNRQNKNFKMTSKGAKGIKTVIITFIFVFLLLLVGGKSAEGSLATKSHKEPLMSKHTSTFRTNIEKSYIPNKESMRKRHRQILRNALINFEHLKNQINSD